MNNAARSASALDSIMPADMVRVSMTYDFVMFHVREFFDTV